METVPFLHSLNFREGFFFFFESLHPEQVAWCMTDEGVFLAGAKSRVMRCFLVPSRKGLVKRDPRVGLKVRISPPQMGILTFHQCRFHSLSSWGIFWPPTPVSLASISTGRVRQTKWRTARMSTRPPTSEECFRRPVYRERCPLSDWCQTTPWTACKKSSRWDDGQKVVLMGTLIHIANTLLDKKATDVSRTLFLYSIRKRDESGIVVNSFASCAVSFNTPRLAQPALPYFTIYGFRQSQSCPLAHWCGQCSVCSTSFL